jgi:hypothetical protein
MDSNHSSMDKALLDYVKKHPRMPLPELKLELMKRGFSAFQIEQAMKTTRDQRQNLLMYLIFILILAVFLIIIGLIFVSFVQPAEKLEKIQIETKTQEQEYIAVPSERPKAPETPYVEEEIKKQEEKEIQTDTEQEITQIQTPSKTLEEIRKISNTNPSQALEECDKLENKDECIGLVAKNSNNVDACNKINDKYIKDNCFYFFGQADKKYCNEILSIDQRNECMILADIQEIK